MISYYKGYKCTEELFAHPLKLEECKREVDELINAKSFEDYLMRYKGMIIETGGIFGEGKKYCNDYVDKCLGIAKICIENSSSLKVIREIACSYLDYFKTETDWKYQEQALDFIGKILDGLDRL
jgi:hypothetical protein